MTACLSLCHLIRRYQVGLISLQKVSSKAVYLNINLIIFTPVTIWKGLWGLSELAGDKVALDSAQ